MSNVQPTKSPLETVDLDMGSNATEAFSILGNETRLAVLAVLWDHLEPFAEDPADSMASDGLRFSELRRRVGVTDPGQFHYHLDQLVGRFVQKTDERFKLNPAGRKVVQSVITTVGYDQQSSERVEIDEPCPNCGTRTEAVYKNYRIYQLCTACGGNFTLGDEHPDGVIHGWKASPPLQQHGSPEAIFQAGRSGAEHQYAMRYDGVCHQCSGPVEHRLHRCEDHDATDHEACPNCHRKFGIGVRFVCSVCKVAVGCPLIKAVLVPHHRVIDEFLVEHDIVPEFPYLRKTPGLETHETVVSTDPLEVRMTLSVDGGQLDLLIDEEVNVKAATD